MASLPQPMTAAARNAQLGNQFILAQQIQMELADKLDLLALGVVPLVGDLSGTGTTVIRVRHAGGIGWNAPLQQLSGETDSVPDASPTAGFTSVSLGQFGLGSSETFLARITSDDATRAAQSIEAFKAMAVDSYKRMFRKEVCKTGQTMASSVGNTSDTLSVDTLIALSTAYNTTDGAADAGPVTVMLDPTPIEEVKASARAEPAFQGDMEGFTMVQGLSGRVYENFLGLNMRVVGSSDVTQSGGGYNGFAFQPGGIGFAKASTSPLMLDDKLNAVYADDFGLVMFDTPTSLDQQTLKSIIMAYVGFALGDSSVTFQRKVLSTT